ncbi:hypothetical protein BGZ95_000028 [Linnemannia exigua]|uniref:Major facilitator superfamily (MFS) profile domain-containing protein n=1 Tax=Linnemannia exigua TaxID=604196 RepID=A0AAD4DPG8_9FUNG|nr:hypothetical protein BGZ95_000028 [Linnemannia exigua]
MDKGLRAWLVVLASTLIQTFAFAPTEFIFGVFEQEYLHIFPSASHSSIALIGTIGSSTTFLVGLFSGVISDRWGYRFTSITGTFIMTAALVLASFSTQLWHLYLSQGLLFGIGASLVYFSSVAAPTHWFEKKRGLAMGISASGSGLGGFFLAPLTQLLIERFAVQWTLRALGIYSLVVCTHIGISKQMGAVINGWFNGASFFARILSGLLADLVATDVLLLVCSWSSTLAILVLWNFSKSFPMYLFFAIIYGITFSGITTVAPVIVANQYGPQQVSGVLGIVYGFSCLALVAGSFISGHILETTKFRLGYLPVIMYSGSMFAVSAIFVTAWVVLLRRQKTRALPSGEAIEE